MYKTCWLMQYSRSYCVMHFLRDLNLKLEDVKLCVTPQCVNINFGFLLLIFNCLLLKNLFFFFFEKCKICVFYENYYFKKVHKITIDDLK